MRFLGRFFCLTLAPLLILSSVAFGQGSAAGAGYGGQGGGFGGGGIGGGGGGFGGAPGGRGQNSEADQPARRPDFPQDESQWTKKTAVLTPGDRVEFKFTLEKGDVLLAGVSSDSFDPALSVEMKGKELQKNDDRAEGDQSPFLNFRAPEKGEYVVKVLSFRSVAGGQFTARFRTVTPIDFAVKGVSSVKVSDELLQKGPAVVRLRLEKGKFYDLRGVSFNQYIENYFVNPNRLIGPSGVELQDFAPVIGDPESYLIEAKVSGDFLAEYYVGSASEMFGNFREMPVLKTTAKGTCEITLAKTERVLIEFPVAIGDIVKTEVKGTNFDLARSLEHVAEDSNADMGGQQGWSWFRTNVESDASFVRAFQIKGTFRMVIQSRGNQPEKFQITNSADIPEWKPGIAIDRQLEIGDAPIYLYRSTLSELARVAISVKSFRGILEIYGLNGQRLNYFRTGKDGLAGDDLYFPKAETYFIRFSCDGNGGSGTYSLKRDTLPAAPYTLGSVVTAEIGGTSLSLYSVKLEAGKRYELLDEQGAGPIRVDLLDETGEFLGPQMVNFKSVWARYFVPVRNGVHRLWLRGSPQKRKFTFREFKEPVIEGISP